MLASPLAEATDRGFAVYVHWPFCLKKCPYCDFNSHVARDLDEGRFVDALLREIHRQGDLLGRRQIDSIFFGGGTPSLMAPESVETVLSRLSDRWQFADNIEITLEANPTSVEASKFRALAAAGVNRLSLGVQSLSQEALAFLGREHTVDEALAALALANHTFNRVSFDLIYARAGQTLATWETELGRALELATGHLSLYQLTIEPGTAFFEQDRRGTILTTDEDTGAALYERTQELCAAADYQAYEVSNYAQADQQSRHNLVYWRYGEYVGIGPGAHGRPIINGDRRASQQVRNPRIWQDQVEQHGHGDEALGYLSPEDRLLEMVLMGLRLTEGVSLASIMRETGLDLRREKAGNIAGLADAGYLTVDERRIKVTATGRPLLNAVLAELLS